MIDVVATFTGSIRVGLTLYVAFVLTLSAAASGPSDGASGFSDAVRDVLQGDEDRSGEGIRYRPTDESPGQYRAMSPPPAPVGTPTPFGPTPPPAPPIRDTIYGAHAYPGPPGGPSYLHPNLPEYQTKYGIWYQPRSFWEPQREVYRPSPFRPRGWGNLFNDDPCRHDRMDYNRYVVKDLPSRYGPSYYPLYQPPGECLVRPERHYKPPVWGSAE